MAEETRTGAPELSLNELLRIRREKLTNLQDAGRDPFAITPFSQKFLSVITIPQRRASFKENLTG